MSSIIKMTSTVGKYVNGSTYYIRAKEAEAILKAGNGTANVTKTTKPIAGK